MLLCAQVSVLLCAQVSVLCAQVSVLCARHGDLGTLRADWVTHNMWWRTRVLAMLILATGSSSWYSASRLPQRRARRPVCIEESRNEPKQKIDTSAPGYYEGFLASPLDARADEELDNITREQWCTPLPSRLLHLTSSHPRDPCSQQTSSSS